VGVKNPAIDDLLEKLVHAKTYAELVTICHALDRILLWEYYVIPHWYIGTFRVAYWDMFGRPAISPKYGLPVEDTWWIDAAKAPKIMAAQKRSP
jgi:microcin C transport system substrate-binding protein